jgi:ComF family protein
MFPADVHAERPMLVPVPLSAARERERGYNQSALLAAGVARRWRQPAMLSSLVRGVATASQTRLDPRARARNVAGAFSLAGDRTVWRGAHVLLVDDVVTTGATLNECATVLFEGGARTVSYLTFGRAPAPGDVL